MFAAYCTGHGSRVLLFSENIEQLVNRPFGVELHWRCTCGTAGTTHIGRETTPGREATPVEAAA